MNKAYYILLGCMVKLTDISESLHNDLEALKAQIFECEDEEVSGYTIALSEIAGKFNEVSEKLQETAQFLVEYRNEEQSPNSGDD